MTEPLILDGKTLAKSTEADLSLRVEAIKKASGGRTPILATILVGSDPASATYVRMKGNACRRVGMDSLVVSMPENTKTEELLAKIDELNTNRDVQGILLQHPVPSQIDERACFDQIAIAKDVDGVTAIGFGLMSMGEPVYGSATPAGIIKILDHYGIEMEGKHILLETGIGAFFDPKMRQRFGVVEEQHVLLDELARLGLAPSDIDLIVL